MIDTNEKDGKAMTQIEAGRAAFLADDDHLLFNCTPEFLESYKEAYLEWAAGEYPRAANNPDSNHLEEYWDAHYEEATTGMANRLLTSIMKPSRKAIAKNVAFGMTAAFITGALFMACLLGENSDVTRFKISAANYAGSFQR